MLKYRPCTLSTGYVTSGDGHDAFACVGVGYESDDRKGFVGWVGHAKRNFYSRLEASISVKMITGEFP